MAAIFLPLAYLLLYLLRALTLHAVVIAAIIGITGATSIYVATFLYFFFKSDLPDPTRTITKKQRNKIIRHLSPYGIDRSPSEIPRQFDLLYYPNVPDADSFGREIQTAMRQAGWAANLFDDNALSEPPVHANGLWVYGKGRSGEHPTAADLLTQAFKAAGLKVHKDPEHWGISGTNFVIGSWE